jgi:excisionase family DNA binding protein
MKPPFGGFFMPEIYQSLGGKMNLMDITEAAAYLHVSRSFVYRECSRGRLAHFKLGAALRCNEAQLEEWLHGREIKPVGNKGKPLSLVS